MSSRIAFVLGLLTLSAWCHAEIVFSSATAQLAPGSAVDLRLTITNEGSEPLLIEVPSPLHLKVETETAVTILQTQPDRSGEIEVAPGGFSVVRLNATLPPEATGMVMLEPTGLKSNALVLHLDGKPSPESVFADQASKPDSNLVDKPPPIPVSVYEPVYFIVGGDDGLNAKFQISLRYRLFDGEGRLASRLPWIDDLYLSFSQTSLWDLDELSRPFTDSSYRPRLFYSNFDIGRLLDGRLRLGVEAGLGHESNGLAGDESRSFNMLYVRPTFTFGDPQGFHAYLAPLIHNYMSEDENPDIVDYRGYVDWQLGVGSKGGWNFWGVLRKGRRSDFGSAELNLSYPLSKLSGGDLTGWLLVQYFVGYGESLLQYDQKLDSQVRLGIAVAL